MNMDMKSHRKNTKNKGQGFPWCAIITPGRLRVKQSINQFILWAKGIIRAGTTSGKYGHTKGPRVNPYIIRSITLNVKMAIPFS